MWAGGKPGPARQANTLLIVVAAALMLVAVNLLPQSNSLRNSARAAEGKSGLNEIQRAVEKYRRDNGCYPPWLIGGEARYAATVDTTTLDGTFQDIRECEQPAAVSDPLLREGYLTAYPRNPFVTAGGLGIHQLQSSLPGASGSGDALCNGGEKGALHGTRFGPLCETMGNVMGDPRQREWTWIDPATDYYHPARTYADVDYHQWDMWANDPPVPFLYGQFFYKSNWELDPPPVDGRGMLESTPMTKPPTMYMLGAYGGPSDRGQDVIGAEQAITLDLGDQGSLRIWPWTRSTLNMGFSQPQGSPYGAAPAGSRRQFTYGNPNGIDDAVVLLLTSK